MSRSAGPLVVGLLLGAVVGAVAMSFLSNDHLQAAGDAAARAAARHGAAAAAIEPETVAPACAGDPVDVVRTASAVEDLHAPRDVVERMLTAAKSAPVPSHSRGTKSIRGRVADVDGAPVAAAVVRATLQGGGGGPEPDRSSLGAPAPERETLGDAVKQAVEDFYARHVDQRDATCDADGRFQLDELSDGDWWLQAWCDGFEIDAATEASVAAGGTCDFVAQAVARFGVSVLLPDGSLAPRAAIVATRVDQERGDVEQAWSPAIDRVALLAGEWEIKATLGDPDRGPDWPDVLASPPQRVKLAAHVAASPLTFRLHGSPGIRGSVRLVGGGRPESFDVKMLPLAPGASPDLELLAQPDIHERSSRHSFQRIRSGDEETTYLFKELSPGRYVVGAQRGWGGRILAHAVVVVGDGMVVQDLELPPLDPADCLRVRLQDQEGRAVVDASLRVRVELAAGGSSERGCEAKREADGSFSVPFESIEDPDRLPRPWPPGTKVTLLASSGRLGEASVELGPSTRSIDVRFGAPAMLVATITGYVGSGYQGRLSLSLDARDEGSQPAWFRFGGDDLRPDGAKTFGPITSGDYRLSLVLRRSGGFWDCTQIASIDLALVAGENHAAIAIPPLYALTIELPGAAGRSIVLHAPDDDHGRGMDRALDDTGRATFEELPAGDYVVTHDGDGEPGSMTVHLDASAVLRFKPAPMNALRVWIRRGDGQLALAGFRSDDLVIGVDGREFATEADPGAAIADLHQKAKVNFMVLRAGERIEIAVEGKILANPFEMGGSLRPTSR